MQRLLRSPQWDEGFPGDKMVPALRATLADLGIDLDSQENIKLDIEQRPQKTPRAFCSPIEVPDKVMLVIQPIGGADDWRAFFHEAGHAEHFGNTSRDLAMEEKRLGDMAVTEGWAMLMQHLTDEPGWLSRKLDFPRPDEYAAEGMLWLLFFVRRYSAKLLYELEFHAADDISGMPKRYAELLGDALKFEISEANYLADIDSGFYVTAYLRSWAFETPAARQPARALRQRLVRPARGRLAAARALVAGPEADRGRAAEGRHRRGDPDVRGRRPRARALSLDARCPV